MTDQDKITALRDALQNMLEAYGEETGRTCVIQAHEALALTADTPEGATDGAADARKGCRDAFNLIANCRKLMAEKKMDKAENWVIACELFAVGSTTAMAICREASIDPMAYKMDKLSKGSDT